jgi:hypothetical protein
VRVYLPSTLTGLSALAATGSLGEPPYDGYAVTAALREQYGAGDAEEHEWAASEEAALGSLRLLAQDPATPRRRVVLPVDVPAGSVHLEEAMGPAGVTVTSAVTLGDVASVHVDSPDAAPAVALAVAALPAADAGDEAAERALAALDDVALEWYATQELADLLR